MKCYFYDNGKHQIKLNKHLKKIDISKKYQKTLQLELLNATYNIYHKFHRYKHTYFDISSEYNFLKIHNNIHDLNIRQELLAIHDLFFTSRKHYPQSDKIFEILLDKIIIFIDTNKIDIHNKFDSSIDFK